MLRRLWNHPAFWVFGVLTWAVALFVLSSRSTAGGMPAIPHFDKVVHFTYFAAGSLCLGRLLRLLAPHWRARAIILTCVAFAALVGVLDEFHQSFTPGRSGNDIGDMIADTLGGLCGGWLAGLFGRKSGAPAA